MNEFNGYYRVLFNKLPGGPDAPAEFIELEDKFGRGVGPAGGSEWVPITISHKEDGTPIGHVELRIPAHPAMNALYKACRKAIDACTNCFEGDVYGLVPEDGPLYVCPICHDAREAVALAKQGK